MPNKILAAAVACAILITPFSVSAQFDLGLLKGAMTKLKEKIDTTAPTVRVTKSAPTSAVESPQKKPAPLTGSIGTINLVSGEVLPEMEGKEVRLLAAIDTGQRQRFFMFDNFYIDGCDQFLAKWNPSVPMYLSGVFAEFSEGGIGAMAAPPTFELKNCRAKDGNGVEINASRVNAKATAVATDNPAIEGWMKTCKPFITPLNMDAKIKNGGVTFRGVKVEAVDTADSGYGSTIALRLSITAVDFNAKFPEIAKNLKFAKSKACPVGGERRFDDKSFDGAKGATIVCSCNSGGD